MPPRGITIRDVVANELADRVQQRKWMYQIDKREESRTLTEEQIDTKDGPLYRLRAINGVPLDSLQRRQDDARVGQILRDPRQQLKRKQEHDDDEQKLEKLMRLMPEAFLYDYDGVDGNLVRLKFRPDPNYNPPTYETRVTHNLSGTILVDPQQKRFAKITGQLTSRVDFGFGLLGHIDDGGIIEIGRIQVGPSQWKTDQCPIVKTSGVLQDNRQATVRDPVALPRGSRGSHPLAGQPPSGSLDS